MSYVVNVRSFIPANPSDESMYIGLARAKHFLHEQDATAAALEALYKERDKLSTKASEPGREYLARQVQKMRAAVFTTELGNRQVMVTQWGFIHCAFCGWEYNEGKIVAPKAVSRTGRVAPFFHRGVPYTYDAAFAKQVLKDRVDHYREQLRSFYTANNESSYITQLSLVGYVSL